ncbi:30S ribosomal protein S6 [Desertihabitans brevis]|uniref:Small ribosomal subunit protein bS6 n=1 Tax=Desertihabitans brevis TaxID=2268447 RepID=A0A367YSH1_9ACTN|nr:30S ribosomal protein S6 [Desertihabitans brevis]RCK68835.1 30S ribosomal protein S6 [Desertihabitans brevis]
MRKYEVMVIIDPDTDDRQVSPLLEQYTKVITDAGGSIENVDVWGKRRLAYEIQKKTEGIYAVINLTATPEAVQEMDRLFGINEQVMRTKVLRPDAH